MSVKCLEESSQYRDGMNKINEAMGLIIRAIDTLPKESEVQLNSYNSFKNSINFYHMGVYADPKLYKWFTGEFPKHTKQKLDMGKSCVRFKKTDDIPYKLIGELMKKISVKDWIGMYEANYNPKSKKK